MSLKHRLENTDSFNGLTTLRGIFGISGLLPNNDVCFPELRLTFEWNLAFCLSCQEVPFFFFFTLSSFSLPSSSIDISQFSWVADFSASNESNFTFFDLFPFTSRFFFLKTGIIGLEPPLFACLNCFHIDLDPEDFSFRMLFAGTFWLHFIGSGAEGFDFFEGFVTWLVSSDLGCKR